MKPKAFVKYNEISTLQLFFLIFLTQFGAGILSLPRDLARVAQHDGWISSIISTLMSLALVYVVVQLSLRFRGLTLVEISRKLLGNFFGNLLSVVYIAYFFAIAAYEIRSIIDLVTTWLLVPSNFEILLFLTILPLLYLTRNGIKVMGRAFTLYFFHLIPMFFIVLWPISQFEPRHILPIGAEGIMPILRGSAVSLMAFWGFEMLLLVGPFVQDPKKMMRTALAASLFTGIIYTLTVFFVTAYFGANELQFQIWPSLYLARGVEIAVLERLDIVTDIIWIIVVFTTLAMYYYLAAFGTSRLFRRKEHKNFVLYLTPLLYFAAKIPDNVSETMHFGGYLGKIGLAMSGIIPLFLLVLAIITGKKEKVKLEKS